MARDLTIKKGYKRMDMGVIPADWDVITYGEAFDFLRTAQYSRDQLDDSGMCQYIHYGDIHTKWEHFVDIQTANLPWIDENHIKNYSLIKDGDLVMADASEDYAGIGKSVEVKNAGDAKVISGLHTFLMRDKGEHFAAGFKGYIHTNPLVKRSMDRYATGLKVYGVSKNNLKQIEIPIPSLEEQSAIARALLDTEALISSLDLLIAKKRNIKRGAMQTLLSGKRRISGYSKKWSAWKLGEIAEFSHGLGLPKSAIDENAANKCIHYGQLFTIYQEVITDVFSRTNLRGNIVLSKKNDVLIPTSDVTPNGLATASCIKEDKVILGGGILIVRLKQGFDGGFLSYYISHNKKAILKLVKGSTVFHLYANDLATLQISLPELNEQQAIVSVLSEMDTEINNLEQELKKYRSLKDGMVQQLLTGNIRLI